MLGEWGNLTPPRGMPGPFDSVEIDALAHPYPEGSKIFGFFFASSNELPVSLTREGFNKGMGMHGTSRASGFA